jgi:hypothetical protein
MKNKWIFKVKRNGIFRARLVTCDCNPAPGIDFNEIYTAVKNNVSFRIMMIAKFF